MRKQVFKLLTRQLLFVLSIALAVTTVVSLDVNEIRAAENELEKAMPVVQGNPDDWVRKPVELEVQKEEKDYLYSFSEMDDQYQWQQSNVSKRFGKNQTVYIAKQDIEGHISPVRKIDITKLDIMAPVIENVEINKKAMMAGKLTFKIIAKDDLSGIEAYSFDGGETWSSTPEKIVSEDAVIQIKVKDKAGNINNYDKSYTFQKQDAIPLLFEQSIEYDQDVPFIKASIEGPDQIEFLSFSFDNGNTWQSDHDADITLNDQKSLNIQVKAISNTFRSTNDPEHLIKLSTPPIVRNNANGPAICEENGVVKIIGQGSLFDDEYVIENENGEYMIDGEPYYAYYSFDMKNWEMYTEPFVLNPKQYGTIYARLIGYDIGYITKAEIKNDYFAFHHSETMFSIALPGATVDFTRSYNSAEDKWMTTFDSSFTKSTIEHFQEVDKQTPSYQHVVSNVLKMRMPDGDTSTFVAANFNEYDDAASFKLVNLAGDILYINNDNATKAQLKKENISYTYINGKLTMISDEYGNQITISYGDIITVDDNLGHIYTYTNDILTDPLGNTQAYHNDGSITYHDANHVNEDITTDGFGAITYDSTRRPKEIIQKNGKFQIFDYMSDKDSYFNQEDNTEGRIFTKYDPYFNLIQTNDSEDYDYYYTYDTEGNMIQTNEKDVITKYQYDDHHNLLKITYANGTTEECSYDYFDRMIRKKTIDDVYTYFTYNQQDDVVIEAELKENATSIPMEYNEQNRSLYFVTSYERDKSGKLTQIINEKENIKESYTYNSAGLRIKTIVQDLDDVDDSTYENKSYDELGRIIKTETPDHTEIFTYDQIGNPILQNSDGKITRMIYTQFGDLKQQIDSDDYKASNDGLHQSIPKNTYADDTVGNRYYYDDKANLIKEINAQGKETLYEYNQYGYMVKTDFDIYHFAQDIPNRLTSVKINDMELLNHTYDRSAKQLLTKTNFANNTSISYGYNNKSLLSSITYGDASTPVYTFDYDASGSRIETIDHGNALKTKYDSYGATTYDLNDEKTILHKYKDKDDEFSESVYDDQFDRIRDDNGKQIFKSDGNATLELDVSKTIDNKYAGTIMNKVNDSFNAQLYSEDYTYEKDLIQGKRIKMKHYDNNLEYTYDEHQNIIRETGTGIDKQYYYDDKDQLIRSDDLMGGMVTVYTYDGRGNITKVGTADKRNYDRNGDAVLEITGRYDYRWSAWDDQISSYNNKRIYYDDLGNRTAYDGWNYTWEAGRLLKSMSKDDMNITYNYDQDGIRTQKNVNGKTTYYTTIDGRITSQYDNTTKLYFQYDEEDNLVGFNYNGTQYLYITNIQHDVIGIADMDGNQLVEYFYDDWGCTTWISGDTKLANINPMRYRGYYLDSETGYYYLQSRYYEPEMKRFINIDDPETLLITKNDDQGMNLYAYCNNNVINSHDNTGYWRYTGIWLSNNVVASGINLAISFLVGCSVTALLKGGLKRYMAKRGIYLASKYLAQTINNKLIWFGLKQISGLTSIIQSVVKNLMDPGGYLARLYDSRDKRRNNGRCDII